MVVSSSPDAIYTARRVSQKRSQSSIFFPIFDSTAAQRKSQNRGKGESLSTSLLMSCSVMEDEWVIECFCFCFFVLHKRWKVCITYAAAETGRRSFASKPYWEMTLSGFAVWMRLRWNILMLVTKKRKGTDYRDLNGWVARNNDSTSGGLFLFFIWTGKGRVFHRITAAAAVRSESSRKTLTVSK